MEIEKQYDPHKYEKEKYKQWEEEKAYIVDVNAEKESYCIVMPPPNITGSLHMGHALNNTLQDIMIRYEKHAGKKSLWIPGMDHAGIATHTVVEKKIALEMGKTRWDLGRDEFEKKIWEWKEKYGNIILEQLKCMMVLPDWSKQRFTLDKGLSFAVYKVFETLYNEGLIYRGKYIINWCPRCHTALADTEVEHREESSKLWYFRYPLKERTDKLEYVVVATTRPETMLGDTAVAVNPNDERYKSIVGKTVILPLQNREIPVIADEFVDMEFGTGVVKVTPYHDPNDYEMGKRHDLIFEKVIDEDGEMCGNIPEIFVNLSRDDARVVVVEELEKLGLIDKIEDYSHSLKICYRCDDVLEPLVSEQWFVKMAELAKPAIEAAEKGDIKFVPDKWKNYYLNWMHNIRDWCISRQLWWGHRIPVFYCKDCNFEFVSQEKKPCPKCQSENVYQDDDVLDTWFSSALWPFSTMGWPENNEMLDKFYPTSVLITDRGIIFNWVARMIMMGLKFINKKPFFDVYIHGTILDEQGRKMSKSLGNGIDPIEMVEKYGSDAVRFSLINLTTFGQDIYLSENKFTMGRNFANKIWNAFRYILLNVKENEEYENTFKVINGFDRWILSRYELLKQKVENSVSSYNFNEYATALYRFFWEDFCDWYLESTKLRLNEKVTIQNLLYIGYGFLKLLNPIMPVITEIIGEKLPDSIKGSRKIYDEIINPANLSLIDSEFEKSFKNMIDWITALRRAKRDFNIPQKQKIDVFLKTSNYCILGLLNELKDIVRDFADIGELNIANEELKQKKQSINVIVNDIVSIIPAEGIIDIKKERERLEKQKKEMLDYINNNENKLLDQEFLKKAPVNVVDNIKNNVIKNRELLKNIEDNLKTLSD